MSCHQHEDSSYVLAFRKDNVEEDQRLNSQHNVIRYGIMGGKLIHPNIPLTELEHGIADLGCGTGAWINDVAVSCFTEDQSRPMLVGFDINAHALDAHPAPGVELIEQDGTKSYDPKWHEKFDLVNIRGLAYALSNHEFSRFLENANKLLRPGGYLQWVETESRHWMVYPQSAQISRALQLIETERMLRDLVLYMPKFMLQAVLSPTFAADPSNKWSNTDPYTIISYALIPGGMSRDKADEEPLDAHFSEIVLESVKLLLNASLIRRMAENPRKMTDDEQSEIQDLMHFIDEVRKSGEVKMGGFYPGVIARKSVEPSMDS